MPETTPPQTPDRPAPSPVWETGETPGDPRTPGTRRLWVAGLLAVAVFSTSAICIFLSDKETDASTPRGAQDAAAPLAPGLALAASPAAAPGGKSGMTSVRSSRTAADASPAPRTANHTAGSQPSARPSKPPAARPTTSMPATTWRSVRSVNYPDRYWHVSGDYVKLDPIGSASARQDATFKLVEGLADASCYSFATADGTYLSATPRIPATRRAQRRLHAVRAGLHLLPALILVLRCRHAGVRQLPRPLSAPPGLPAQAGPVPGLRPLPGRLGVPVGGRSGLSTRSRKGAAPVGCRPFRLPGKPVGLRR
jgi:hypothetical protein